MDLDKPVELKPVSQWVYDLYKVTYWTADPAGGGREIRSTHIASSCESHLVTDAWDLHAPRHAEYMTFVVVKENVGHPRVVGQMYGRDVYEDGHTQGRRLAEQM